jgi:uncharacterized protein
MSQVLNLYRLQQIDSLIDRLQIRLQEIDGILKNDTKLQRLNEVVHGEEQQHQSAENKLSQTEEDVRNQIIKIEQTQSSLYGKKAHTPKELQDLQNDLYSLKRHLLTLEDRQIEAMEECETREESLRYAHIQLEDAKKERAEECNEFLREQLAKKSELEKCFIERNAITGAIPENELTLYQQLRRQRRGVAVALISENSCTACGSNLSLAQIQSAHSSDHMLLCPSCGRILYGN